MLLGAGIAGLPAPLLRIQILWLNLLTDTFPALALALEPPEPGILRRPHQLPLSGRDWLVIGGLGLIPGITGQTVKWLRSRRR